MSYNLTRRTAGDFDAVVARVKEALKAEGFGVLTEIDVAGTLKAKIGKDFRPYRILGACNPTYAFEALSEEPHIGVMLPCNVIVQRFDDGAIEVSSIDPATTMQSVGNASLEGVAGKLAWSGASSGVPENRHFDPGAVRNCPIKGKRDHFGGAANRGLTTPDPSPCRLRLTEDELAAERAFRSGNGYCLAMVAGSVSAST
jgi:uncharacterized protein (DUF302 family)